MSSAPHITSPHADEHNSFPLPPSSAGLRVHFSASGSRVTPLGAAPHRSSVRAHRTARARTRARTLSCATPIARRYLGAPSTYVLDIQPPFVRSRFFPKSDMQCNAIPPSRLLRSVVLGLLALHNLLIRHLICVAAARLLSWPLIAQRRTKREDVHVQRTRTRTPPSGELASLGKRYQQSGLERRQVTVTVLAFNSCRHA